MLAALNRIRFLIFDAAISVITGASLFTIVWIASIGHFGPRWFAWTCTIAAFVIARMARAEADRRDREDTAA